MFSPIFGDPADGGAPYAATPVPSPRKYYPFEKDADDRIRAALTPSAKKPRRVVYKIKHIPSGRSYTGKTGQPFSKRVHGHHYAINHPEKDAGKSELYQDLREHPEEFAIGVQMQAAPEENLDDLENLCIQANQSQTLGYNHNVGGGGGEALSPVKTPPSTPKLSKTQSRTPAKGRRLDVDESDRIKIPLSPVTKKRRGVVYGFKNIRTGQWLIGETEQAVAKRMSAYVFAFNHPEKDAGKRPLPRAVRENPEDFMFYVLSDEPLSGARLKKMEKAWIKAKGSYGQGYNQNPGGGGSSLGKSKI